MPKVRTFIALPLPESIRSSMADLQTQLIESHADVKWDRSDKFHLTLKFLGDTEASILPQMVLRLQQSIGSFPCFEISYSGLGGFPNREHPRVVWIGAKENPQALRLQQIVDEVCTSFGYAKEDRAFHVHITLGRVRGNRNLDRLTASLKSITFEPLVARCTEVCLMRSELKPAGSVYTLLNSIPLAS